MLQGKYLSCIVYCTKHCLVPYLFVFFDSRKNFVFLKCSGDCTSFFEFEKRRPIGPSPWANSDFPTEIVCWSTVALCNLYYLVNSFSCVGTYFYPRPSPLSETLRRPVLVLFQQSSQTTKQNYESLINIEDKRSGDAKSIYIGHRKILEDPEFIISIVVAQYVPSFLKPLALFLEKTKCDMVVAFDEAQNTPNTLKGLRMDDKFSERFARAQMEVVLQPMRRLGRQVHRDNPTCQFCRTIMANNNVLCLS